MKEFLEMLGVLESGGGRLLGVILEVVGVRTGGVDMNGAEGGGLCVFGV